MKAGNVAIFCVSCPGPVRKRMCKQVNTCVLQFVPETTLQSNKNDRNEERDRRLQAT